MIPARPAILLDVEGTTTPVAFVHDVLFPFARAHVADFLARHADDDSVRADLALLRAEHARAAADGAAPAWHTESAEAEHSSAVAYVHWLMDRDRKSTGLKALQGRIWAEGYASGALQGSVYDDVRPAFERWQANERDIAIFSSGSLLAQRLLFGHSTAGDLTGFIAAHFDTTTGAKVHAASYARIAADLGRPPAHVLFVSDVTHELDAARDAGLATALCVRPGRAEPERSAHPVIRTFDDIRD